jgi:sulfate adenylyltransferase subunit 2
VGSEAASARSSGRCTTRASHPSEHLRVFPISNWTELDVWQYIVRERIALPDIYFAHDREVIERGDRLLAVTRCHRHRAPANRSRHAARALSAPWAT